MIDYKATRLNYIVESALQSISFYESDMLRQIYNTANFTSKGTLNKSPLWSTRGHIAELHHQYTFKINSIAKLINQNRYGVSTDKIGIGLPRVTRNNPLVDIQVYDFATGQSYGYQAKVCNTKEASMEAVSAKKYLDNNVIPLVPRGHNSVYDKINVGDVSSDPISVDELNQITNDNRKGIVRSHIADKRSEIYINSLKYSAIISVLAALQAQLIKVVLNEISGNSNEMNIADIIIDFVKDSISNFIYSSVGVGMTLLTGNAVFSSMFLGSIRVAVINLKQFLDGELSFNEFLLKSGFDVAVTSLSISASIIVADGLSISSIRKIVPILKFGGIILVISIIAVSLNDFGDSTFKELKREILVSRQRRLINNEYYKAKRNITIAFNQLEKELKMVMKNMVKYVLSQESYFNTVNCKLLDIELSTEGLLFDEINCIDQVSSIRNNSFMSVENILKLL